MQNTNSDTDFDKLKISSAEHISSVESFFSHSGILNKCKDLIASPKDKAIQIFLKEVHSHITKIISPNHTDNDHKNLKEVPWIFYCIFNLLLNLLNTPGHYSLLEQISGLIQLYFDFLEISEQDYGLCFVEENSELINLYTSAHSGISSLKFESIEINIIDIPDANRVGSRNEIDNKNLTDNPPQTETQPNGNELEGFSEANQSTADKKGIKSLKLLSVDLLLVEILEFFFTREDAKDQKDIAKSLEKLYETLSMNLLFYVVYTQSFSMAVVNRLARCALESLKWLFKHKETQHLYLQSLRGPKMEYIEFFLQLLGLNLNDSPSNTVQLRIKVPSHMPLMYKSTKKTEKFSTSVIIGNEAEVSFITDPLFRDPKDAVNMYKETIIVSIGGILA